MSNIMSGHEWLKDNMDRFSQRIEQAEMTIEECRNKKQSLGRLRDLLEIQNQHGTYARGYFQEELAQLGEDLKKLDTMKQDAESTLNQLTPKLETLKEIDERMNRS